MRPHRLSPSVKLHRGLLLLPAALAVALLAQAGLGQAAFAQSTPSGRAGSATGGSANDSAGAATTPGSMPQAAPGTSGPAITPGTRSDASPGGPPTTQTPPRNGEGPGNSSTGTGRLPSRDVTAPRPQADAGGARLLTVQAVATPPTASAPTPSQGMAAVGRRIRDLHDRLKITPAQQPQWDEFAAVMLGNAQRMDSLHATLRPTNTAASAVDEMREYARVAQQHADDMQKLIPPFEALYATMTPDQKRVTDQTFRRFEAREERWHARGS